MKSPIGRNRKRIKETERASVTIIMYPQHLCDKLLLIECRDYDILFSLFILSSIKDFGMTILDEKFEAV